MSDYDYDCCTESYVNGWSIGYDKGFNKGVKETLALVDKEIDLMIEEVRKHYSKAYFGDTRITNNRLIYRITTPLNTLKQRLVAISEQ